MYRRVPPKCTEPHDVEAFELLQQARDLEGSGDSMGALALFKRVRRLSPGIAAAYSIL